MSFTVDSSGLQALRDRLVAVYAALPTTMMEAIDEVAQEALVQLQDATPYDPEPDNGTIPGEEEHLRDSYNTTPASYGMVSEAEVTTFEPIKFGYVTGGTSGPIYPRVKKALWWPALDHPVGSVQGQSANPFHEAVAEEVVVDGAEIIANAVRALIEG